MFTVVTPAADRNLLCLGQMRAAAGLAAGDDTHDMDLGFIGIGVSDQISRECSVAEDGIHPPTLLRETVSQTFRLSRAPSALLLARRFIASVSSVVVDGNTLPTDQYEIDASAGMLRRLCDGRRQSWHPGTISVTYEAGFSNVPSDLALAASQAVRERWSASSRDPLLKRERVDGVSEQEFWVGGLGAAGGAALSPAVAALLDPFRSAWVP